MVRARQPERCSILDGRSDGCVLAPATRRCSRYVRNTCCRGNIGPSPLRGQCGGGRMAERVTCRRPRRAPQLAGARSHARGHGVRQRRHGSTVSRGEAGPPCDTRVARVHRVRRVEARCGQSRRRSRRSGVGRGVVVVLRLPGSAALLLGASAQPGQELLVVVRVGRHPLSWTRCGHRSRFAVPGVARD